MNKILISKQLLRSRITLIAFLCLFPLDAVFYTFRTVYGVRLPPVGLPMALMIWVLLLPHIRLIKGKKLDPILVFVAFLISGAFCASFSPFFDYQWLPLYFWYVTFLVLGYHFSQVILLKDQLTKRLIVTFSLFSSTVLILILKDGFLYSVYTFNYLRTASSIFYISLLSITITKNRTLIFFIYIATAVAFFYINSRTSFYLWLSLPMLFFIVSFRFSVRTAVYGLVLALITFLIWRNIDYLEIDSNIRIFRLIFNSEQDTSLQGRLFANSAGWEQIIDNPILGYYNGFLVYADEGLYIHNILSYWHQFGLLAFVFLLVMIGFAVNKAFNLPNHVMGIYLKLSLVTSIIGLIMAKSFASNDIFFLIGLSAGVSYFGDEKNINLTSKN